MVIIVEHRCRRYGIDLAKDTCVYSKSLVESNKCDQMGFSVMDHGAIIIVNE
jgi:hypothetical protein